jgi:LPS-assembly lipoprotein
MMLRILALSVLLLVAGCSGYRPLYGTGADGKNVADTLSSISVQEQRSRTGQLLRNNLLAGLSSGGVNQFELRMAISDYASGVSTLNTTTVYRKRYNLSVRYELFQLNSGVLVTSGTSFANVSYDTLREPVADLQAAENARDRATTQVAQDIRQRLAAFMATRQP